MCLKKLKELTEINVLYLYTAFQLTCLRINLNLNHAQTRHNPKKKWNWTRAFSWEFSCSVFSLSKKNIPSSYISAKQKSSYTHRRVNINTTIARNPTSSKSASFKSYDIDIDKPWEAWEQISSSVTVKALLYAKFRRNFILNYVFSVEDVNTGGLTGGAKTFAHGWIPAEGRAGPECMNPHVFEAPGGQRPLSICPSSDLLLITLVITLIAHFESSDGLLEQYCALSSFWPAYNED